MASKPASLHYFGALAQLGERRLCKPDRVNPQEPQRAQTSSFSGYFLTVFWIERGGSKGPRRRSWWIDVG
jgi:hypothetical protein